MPSGGRGAQCSDCALSVLRLHRVCAELRGCPPNPKLPVRIDAVGEHGVIHPDGALYAGHFLWWLPQGMTFLAFYRELAIMLSAWQGPPDELSSNLEDPASWRLSELRRFCEDHGVGLDFLASGPIGFKDHPGHWLVTWRSGGRLSASPVTPVELAGLREEARQSRSLK